MMITNFLISSMLLSQNYILNLTNWLDSQQLEQLYKATTLSIGSGAIWAFFVMQTYAKLQGRPLTYKHGNNIVNVLFIGYILIFLIRFCGPNVTDALILIHGFKLFFLVIVWFFNWRLIPPTNISKKFHFEIPFFMLLLVYFFTNLIETNNMLVCFFSLVGYSIVMCILLGITSTTNESREATIKYFFISNFNTAILCMGIYFMYKHTHSFDLLTFFDFMEEAYLAMPQKVNHITPEDIIACECLAAIGGILLGFLFLLGLFPGNLWVVPVYSQASYPLLGVMAIPFKVAVLFMFLKIFYLFGHFMPEFFRIMLSIPAIGSIIYGTFGAMQTKEIKRFIAYSSMNQMGFIILGVLSFSVHSFASAMFFLIIYVVSNIGFIVFCIEVSYVKFYKTYMKTDFKKIAVTDEIKYFSQFGMTFYKPQSMLIMLTLTIFLLSMAGIPPLGGFISKYYIISELVQNSHVKLAIFAVISSLFSCFYYIRVIKIAWFESSLTKVFGALAFLPKDTYEYIFKKRKQFALKESQYTPSYSARIFIFGCVIFLLVIFLMEPNLISVLEETAHSFLGDCSSTKTK